MSVITVSDILKPMIDSGIENLVIVDSVQKAYMLINSSRYHNIAVSVSGGSDSDIVVDIISKVDLDKKVRYIFFDTGLEYSATKEHLDFLENKYNIKIERLKAYKSIPTCVKSYGQPFLSKQISSNIESLQRYSFEWDDTDDYIYLIKKYCKKTGITHGKSVFIDGFYYEGCVSAILWWCNVIGKLPWNKFARRTDHFNISRKKYLKDFLVENPPKFKISSKCCAFAKKKTVQKFHNQNNTDLDIIGVRKSEGGIRSTSYKKCYDVNFDTYDKYRPIFWYTNEDKYVYNQIFGCTNSECYSKWGFARTGCAGCPFDLDLESNMCKIKLYEPRFYKAAISVFKDSYEYARQYKEFVRTMERKERGVKSLW